MMRFLGSLILVAVVVAMAAAALRPVCVPMSSQDVARSSVPFDDRTDKDLFFLKVYQRKGRVRYECKTWLTREVLS